MKLGIKDRIILPTILPKEGNFTTLVVKADLLDKIKITQEEIKEFEIESQADSIKWNPEKDKKKEFELTELEINLVKDCLKKLDETGKLNDDTFNLFKLFN